MVSFFKCKFIKLISDTRFSEILSGSFWALSGRVIAAVLNLAFNVLVARQYGAEVLGIVAVISSFLILANVLTVLGTDTSILRLIPEHLVKYSPTSALMVYRKSQWLIIVFSVITGAISFFSADFIAIRLFSKPHLAHYFALASVFVVFRSVMLLNTNAVRSLRLIKLFAAMQFLPHACSLIFLITVGLLWPASDVPIYALLFGFAFTGIIGLFIVELVLKKRLGPTDIIAPMQSRAILSISLPMFMTAAMVFVIGYTGVLMVGIFRSEVEVGYYDIAVKLATLTGFVLGAINSVVAPKFSTLFHSGKIDDLFYVAKKSAKLVFVTTVPIMIFILVFGKFILGNVFGHGFINAYPALVFLVIGQFVYSISGPSAIFMNMTDNHNIFRNIITIAGVLNIIFNFLLIPPLGICGAALANMISLCFWNITTLSYMKTKYGKTTGYFPFCHFLKFKPTKN